ncbi:uncharacterized protein PV07_00912 [Cladophialophora immunda]|uniref:Uncharacterized protein n=1 Tax=Cladophialophora immunda TaxID=569365 RepID=A0A0D2A145_9EURO|nr:uncharacterized protein PV07_00912 [Cladophialophora immunda]KIW34116.1 hypothetical protein PV07_00912 [Cladophialophora immunda]
MHKRRQRRRRMRLCKVLRHDRTKLHQLHPISTSRCLPTAIFNGLTEQEQSKADSWVHNWDSAAQNRRLLNAQAKSGRDRILVPNGPHVKICITTPARLHGTGRPSDQK